MQKKKKKIGRSWDAMAKECIIRILVLERRFVFVFSFLLHWREVSVSSSLNAKCNIIPCFSFFIYDIVLLKLVTGFLMATLLQSVYYLIHINLEINMYQTQNINTRSCS